MAKRILHVVADAQFGGAQWYLVELARTQRARGDRVTIVTGGAGPLWDEYEGASDAAIRSSSLRRGLGLSDIAAAREIARVARGHDVVHAHASKALLVSELPPNRKPVIWSAHGYDSAHAMFPVLTRSPAALGKALLARHAGAISVASQTVAKKVRRAGVRPERIRVIYTGVNTDRFGAIPDVGPRRPIVVGAAGRLVGIKGFDTLVLAAARVLARERDVRFLLYGGGPKERDLRERIRQLGIGAQFEIRPATNDFPSALAEMDIVVVPSLLDSFPLVPCEAMVAGRPVIASRVGGLPEAFVDGVQGRLVEPGDPEDLARALIGLVSQPERVRVMGAAARTYATERYRWDRVADEYDELYRMVSA